MQLGCFAVVLYCGIVALRERRMAAMQLGCFAVVLYCGIVALRERRIAAMIRALLGTVLQPRDGVAPHTGAWIETKRLLAVCNQKGGVGKTTTTANLAVALGELDYQVLMLDLDPRADLTSAFGIDGEALAASIYEALFDSTVSLQDIATALPCCGNVILAPANSNLAAAELLLMQRAPGQRERVLANALEKTSSSFDFVLMDTPPGLNLLAINALAAAGEIVAPQQCSFIALHGLRQLERTIAGVREAINPALRFCGIVATMRDSRTIHHREVIALMHEAFGDLLFDTVIPASIRFQEAPVAAQPVVTYAPHSPGAIAYMALAKEIIQRA